MMRRAFRPLTLALGLLACGNPCRDALAAEDKPAVAIPPGGVQLWNCGYWASVWPGQFSGNNGQGVKELMVKGQRVKGNVVPYDPSDRGRTVEVLAVMG